MGSVLFLGPKQGPIVYRTTHIYRVKRPGFQGFFVISNMPLDPIPLFLNPKYPRITTCNQHCW